VGRLWQEEKENKKDVHVNGILSSLREEAIGSSSDCPERAAHSRSAGQLC